MTRLTCFCFLLLSSACQPEDLDLLTEEVQPSKRSEIRGAYNPQTDEILMFGGNNGPIVNQFPRAAYVDETWLLTPGFGWAQVEGDGPSARARYAVVVDEAEQRALLYGGRWRDADSSGDYTLFGDLWAFDFATRTWTELHNGRGKNAPDPRYYPNGIWNADEGTLTVWGGNLNTDPLAFEVTDQIWRWDGTDWTDLTDDQFGDPPADRSFLGSTHDVLRNRLVVFGGQRGNLQDLAFNDTYALELDSLEWTRLHDGNNDGRAPSTRMHGPVMHDTLRDRYVLFGGHTDLGDMNDLWSFDPQTNKWKKLYIADKFTGERFGCQGNESEVPADYVSMDLSAPERRHNALVVGARDSLWIYGGMHAECSDHLDDTWRFDLTSELWTELQSANSGESCARRGDDCACLCL
jgi:N-acetylneuraminic acid mutarotase